MSGYSEIEGVMHYRENLSVKEIVYLRKMIARDKVERKKRSCLNLRSRL